MKTAVMESKTGSLDKAKWVALLISAGLMIALLWPGSASAQNTSGGPLTAQEKRGKRIYLRCVSPSGQEITAFLGDAATSAPGETMTCVNCHGFDGRGRPEGGVTPSDVTWSALTKPYGVTHTSGRKHPPYDERMLARSIVRGLDPAGNKLPAAMPTYWMPAGDLADLVAYMKRLGTDVDPGLSQDAIKIGTVLPTRGPLAEMGEAMKAALSAYFAEVNGQGGIYNRRLELRLGAWADSPSGIKSSFEELINEQQVFALAGAFMAGAEKEVAALMEAEEVPLVGPQTLLPRAGFPPDRHLFYLFSGLGEQSRTLVEFAARRLSFESARLALVYAEGEAADSVLSAVEDQCARLKLGQVRRFSYPPGKLDATRLVKQLMGERVDLVFFVGGAGDQLALVGECDRAGWSPYLLIPGSLVGREILDAPPSFKGKILLSFPTLPSDQAAAGLAEFRALAEKYKLPARHIAAQMSVYSAAKILVEGLKRAGKELSREKLVVTLEGLYDFDTGLTPRITYGPNRRIGALGAYILTVDVEKKTFAPVSDWITLSD